MPEVKYSVGQNSTDHKSGSPTITIVSGVATFSEAQVATNLVAGDRVTYNTSSICYLFSKVNGSLTQWNVITAVGGTPGNVTGQTVNSIGHEYTSLSAAEAGAGDANHLNTSNLATGTFNLTFVLCYDSGSDTTRATFNGWTTSASYKIKVFVPYDTRVDCNLPQRHTGKWTAAAWNLTETNEECITNNTNYIRFEGLQIYVSGAASYGCEGIYNAVASGDVGIEICNCIIRGTPTVAYDNHYGIDMRSTPGNGTLKIWNNIIYDFRRTTTAFAYALAINQSGTGKTVLLYAYNNTFHNCQLSASSAYFASASDSTFYLKNNCSQDIVGGAGNWEWDYQYYNPACDYNISTGATKPSGGGGANDKVSQSVSFKDEANGDFHLAYADTSARQSGTNLSADGNLAVVDDVDSIPRPTVFDIGADQFDILKPRNRIENY